MNPTNNANQNQPPVSTGTGPTSRRRARSSGKTESILARMPSMKTTGRAAADKGSVFSKLGNMSRKQAGMLAAACAALVALPLAVSTMMDDAGQNSRRLAPGFATRETPSENLYDPSIMGYAPGSGVGTSGGISPLSAFDPLSLIIGEDDHVMTAPVSAPIDREDDYDDYRNSLRQNTGRAASDGLRAAAPATSQREDFRVKYAGKGGFNLQDGGGASNTRGSTGRGSDRNLRNAAKQASKSSGPSSSVAPIAPKGYRGVVSGGGMTHSAKGGGAENLAARAAQMGAYFQGQNAVQALDKASSDSLQGSIGSGGDNKSPSGSGGIQNSHNVTPANRKYGDKDSFEDWLKKKKLEQKWARQQKLEDLLLGFLKTAFIDPAAKSLGEMTSSKVGGLFEEDQYCITDKHIEEKLQEDLIADGAMAKATVEGADPKKDAPQYEVIDYDKKIAFVDKLKASGNIEGYYINKYNGKSHIAQAEAEKTCKNAEGGGRFVTKEGVLAAIEKAAGAGRRGRESASDANAAKEEAKEAIAPIQTGGGCKDSHGCQQVLPIVVDKVKKAEDRWTRLTEAAKKHEQLSASSLKDARLMSRGYQEILAQFNDRHKEAKEGKVMDQLLALKPFPIAYKSQTFSCGYTELLALLPESAQNVSGTIPELPTECFSTANNIVIAPFNEDVKNLEAEHNRIREAINQYLGANAPEFSRTQDQLHRNEMHLTVEQLYAKLGIDPSNPVPQPVDERALAELIAELEARILKYEQTYQLATKLSADPDTTLKQEVDAYNATWAAMNNTENSLLEVNTTVKRLMLRGNTDGKPAETAAPATPAKPKPATTPAATPVANVQPVSQRATSAQGAAVSAGARSTVKLTQTATNTNTNVSGNNNNTATGNGNVQVTGNNNFVTVNQPAQPANSSWRDFTNDVSAGIDKLGRCVNNLYRRVVSCE